MLHSVGLSLSHFKTGTDILFRQVCDSEATGSGAANMVVANWYSILFNDPLHRQWNDVKGALKDSGFAGHIFKLTMFVF